MADTKIIVGSDTRFAAIAQAAKQKSIELRDEVQTLRNQLQPLLDSLTELMNVEGDLANLNAVAAKLDEIDGVFLKLAEIEAVNGKLTEIEGVFLKLAEIQTIFDNLAAVNTVAGIDAQITALGARTAEIDALFTNLAQFLALHAALSELLAIHANLAALLNVEGDLTEIKAVEAKLVEIQAVFDQLQDIEDVAGALVNIGLVAGSVANVNTVAGAIANVNTVADNVAAINTAATNIAAIIAAPAQAEAAEESAALAIAAAGVDPDFVSYEVGVLPDSTGATTETKGAYFKDADTWQLLEWDGSEWQEIGESISTKTYVDNETLLLSDRIDPLEAGQSAGVIGYADKATMDADTAQDTGALALVTNDATTANNGWYRWDGSVWVKRASFYANEIDPEDEDEAVTGKAVADYAVTHTDSVNYFEIIDDEGYVIISIDENGRFYPSASIKEEIQEIYEGRVLFETNDNIFEIIDDEGYVVQAITTDGKYYPSVPPIQPDDKEAKETAQIKTAESLSQSVMRDGIWNQWIEPLGVKFDGAIFINGPGQGNAGRSPIFVAKDVLGKTKRISAGFIRSTGSFQVDDHNAGSFLVDERENADYPIMFFQAEHNSHPFRFARFGNTKLEEWEFDYNTVGLNVAYTQSWRYNDEIFVLSRRSASPRPWQLAYSSDNGDNWTYKNIFETPASWLYCLGKVKKDKSGVNIAFHGHPKNSDDQGIYFLELDFASGSVINPSDRANPVISDIRNALTNEGFEPIDPFSVGLQIYTPSDSNEITRLFDIARNSAGNCFCVLDVWPEDIQSYANVRSGKRHAVSFSIDDGTINFEVEIDDAGMPFEVPAGNNFYTSGGCVIDDTNALISLKWDVDTGKSIGQIIIINDENNIDKLTFIDTDTLIMRPYSVADSGHFIFCEVDKYTTFEDWHNSRIIIKNINELIEI